MSFPIVEYGCSGELRWDQERGTYNWTWNGKRSVDLRWVAGVQEHGYGAIVICMCGSGHWDAINANYADFMRDWTRAKGLSV